MLLTCDDCLEDHFLGVKGSCNASIGICICPIGFSGKDDWESFNSCHVDDILRERFHLTMGVFASLCLILSVFMFFNTFKRYKKLKSFLKDKRRKSQRKLYAARDMCFIMLLTVGMNLTSGLFDFNFVFSDSDSFGYFQATLFGLMNFFQQLLAFTMVLAWVHTLPSVEIYGQLLGINPFLVKYPNMVFWAVAIGYIYAIVRGIVTIVLLTEDSENAINHIQLFSNIDAGVSFPVIFFLTVYAFSLRSLLRKSIARIEKSSTTKEAIRSNESISLKSMQEALSLCKWFNAIVVGFVLYAIFNSVIFILLGGLNQYFFIGVHFGFLNLALAVLLLRLNFSYKFEAEIAEKSNETTIKDKPQTQTQISTHRDELVVTESDL